jgi:hypothetical protein
MCPPQAFPTCVSYQNTHDCTEQYLIDDDLVHPVSISLSDNHRVFTLTSDRSPLLARTRRCSDPSVVRGRSAASDRVKLVHRLLRTRRSKELVHPEGQMSRQIDLIINPSTARYRRVRRPTFTNRIRQNGIRRYDTSCNYKGFQEGEIRYDPPYEQTDQ